MKTKITDNTIILVIKALSDKALIKLAYFLFNFFNPPSSSSYPSKVFKALTSFFIFNVLLEFFVALDPELANVHYLNPSNGPEAFSADGGFGGPGLGDGGEAVIERGGELRLWESKYQFRKEMLPTFVGEIFGKKVRLPIFGLSVF